MADGQFVAYFRVSTARQGRSGLGLEAQQVAVAAHLNGGKWTMAASFTEVESGKNADRPELAKAMDLCRLTGATLVIAKLDRLSRDAAFLIGLEQSGVNFIAADMPNANRLTVRLMAVIAQEEREMIARRTKDALAASKARGKVLGGWRGGPKVDSRAGVAGKQAKADAFAVRVLPVILRMHEEGKSLNQIASKLTASCVITAQGGAWTATGVRRVLARTARDGATERNGTLTSAR